MTEFNGVYRFGEFELDTAAYELRRGGEQISIEPRALDLLVHLIRNSDRVVSRDELVDAVWPGSFISDSALGQSVLKARRAVDDDGRRQEVIRTVHGRGLRFVADAVEVPTEVSEPVAAQPEDRDDRFAPRPTTTRRPGVRLAVVAVVVAASAATAALLLLRSPPGDRGTRLALIPFTNRTGDASLEWIEVGLPRLLGRTLAEAGDLEVVSDRSVGETLARLDGDAGRGFDRDAFETLHETTGATHAVTAELTREDDLFRMAVGIWERGRRPRRLELSAPRVPDLLDDVARTVGARVLGNRDDGPVRAGFSDDPLVNRLYAMGLAEYERDNYRGAESYFRVCLDREPDLHWARYELALCQRRLGNWSESLELSDRVLDAAIAGDDWRLQAAVHYNMGLSNWRLGTLDQAEQHYLAAAAIADANDLRDVQAPVLLGLGILWSERGQTDRAETAQRQSLAVYREMGDRSGEASALNSLGVLAWRRGGLETSRRMHERALVIRRELGKRHHEAASLNNLGTIARATGRWEEADELFEQALAVRRELEDRVGQASTLYNLSSLALLRSRPERSRELAEEALGLARELGDRERTAWSLGQLAEIERVVGNADAAHSLSLEVLELERELQDRQSEANQMLVLGQLSLDRGEPARAEEWCDEARAIANTLGNSGLEAREARLRGAIAAAAGDADRALELYRTALDASRQVGQTFDVMTTAVELAGLLLDGGDLPEASSLEADLEPFASAGYPPAALALARLRAAQGRSEEATSLAEAARSAAGTMWTAEDQAAFDRIVAAGSG